MLLERTKGRLDYPGSTSTCLLPGFYSSFGRKIIIPLFKLKESKETEYNRHTPCSVSFSQPSMIQHARKSRLFSCSPESDTRQGHLFLFIKRFYRCLAWNRPARISGVSEKSEDDSTSKQEVWSKAPQPFLYLFFCRDRFW